MKKNIEHLKAQLTAVTELRAWIAGEIAELESPDVEKWEPKGGEWRISKRGEVKQFKSTEGARTNGTERGTSEQAVAASERMRTFNRLDAWIDENVAGHVGCRVYFGVGFVYVSRSFDPEKVAILAQLVNDGVVKL